MGPIRKPLSAIIILEKTIEGESNTAKVGHVPDISRWDARWMERERDADGCGRGYFPALMMLVASLTE